MGLCINNSADWRVLTLHLANYGVYIHIICQIETFHISLHYSMSLQEEVKALQFFVTLAREAKRNDSVPPSDRVP